MSGELQTFGKCPDKSFKCFVPVSVKANTTVQLSINSPFHWTPRIPRALWGRWVVRKWLQVVMISKHKHTGHVPHCQGVNDARWVKYSLWHMYCTYWGREATEALPSLGAGETAQRFGQRFNTQPAGLNPPSLPTHGEMCVRATFHDTGCSSGRLSLVGLCDEMGFSFL